MFSAPSTPTNRASTGRAATAGRAAEAAAAHGFLLSPLARRAQLIAQHSSSLTVPPDHLLREYWDKPRSALTTEQTSFFLDARQYEDYVKDLQEGIEEQMAKSESLALRKQEAEEFLRTVDGNIQKARDTIKLLANKQISARAFLATIVAKKETVDFLLTYSESKPFATMDLEDIRALLGLEHTGKVDGLSFLGCIGMLYILSNMNLDFNKDFEGDNPSEENNFKGVILTGKGETSIRVLKQRIISYLKVPPAPSSGAPSPQDATAHTLVGRAPPFPPGPALDPTAPVAAAAAAAATVPAPAATMTKQERRAALMAQNAALMAQLAELDNEEESEPEPPAKKQKC